MRPLNWRTDFLLNKLLNPARLVGLLSQGSPPPCLAGLSMVLAKRRARLSVAPWCLEMIREGRKQGLSASWYGVRRLESSLQCHSLQVPHVITCQFSRIACAFHSWQVRNSQRLCSGCTLPQNNCTNPRPDTEYPGRFATSQGLRGSTSRC